MRNHWFGRWVSVRRRRLVACGAVVGVLMTFVVALLVRWAGPAETYNRRMLNVRWSLLSLPATFPGRNILEDADANRDKTLDPYEASRVDWIRFSDAVGNLQRERGDWSPSRRLDPATLDYLTRDCAFPLPDPEWLAALPFPRQRMLHIAESQMGVHEKPGRDRHHPAILEYARATGLAATIQNDETPWCSAFLNWCALQAGLRGSGGPDARSWDDDAVAVRVSRPEPGDLVVLWRERPSSWKGHVGIYHSCQPERGIIYVLGGNQDNAVCLKAYPAERLLCYRRLRPAP